MPRVVRREVRKRGFFGWVFLLIFFAFNLFMVAWLLMYWHLVNPMMNSGTEAARTGASIGATMATGMILIIWAAGGVVTGLLALLTRGSKTYIEEYD